MEQLEKVVKGMECCIASNNSYCPDECPYNNICMARKGTQHIYVHLFEDALALINKQQERIKAMEAGQKRRNTMITDEMKTDFLGGLFKESFDAYDAMIESADKIIEKAKCGNEERTNANQT